MVAQSQRTLARLRIERLRHVVVGPPLESSDFIAHVTGGENNDGQRFTLASNSSNTIQPSLPGNLGLGAGGQTILSAMATAS